MVFNREDGLEKEKLKEVQFYREAFDHYDWNKNGKIPVKVRRKAQSFQCIIFLMIFLKDLQYAMRRAGQNPTDIEVHDMVNKIENGSGVVDFEDFLLFMREKNKETDMEIHFKDTFRAFSKDDDGEKGKYEL